MQLQINVGLRRIAESRPNMIQRAFDHHYVEGRPRLRLRRSGAYDYTLFLDGVEIGTIDCACGGGAIFYCSQISEVIWLKDERDAQCFFSTLDGSLNVVDALESYREDSDLYETEA